MKSLILGIAGMVSSIAGIAGMGASFGAMFAAAFLAENEQIKNGEDYYGMPTQYENPPIRRTRTGLIVRTTKDGRVSGTDWVAAAIERDSAEGSYKIRSDNSSAIQFSSCEIPSKTSQEPSSSINSRTSKH